MPTGTDLLCPNIVLPKLFFFLVLEKWTDFQSFFFLLFHFNFSCFTHNCFLLTVWPKRLISITSECFSCFFFRIENFEFCRVSHFCVVLFFFPVSRWFSFWKISDSHWFSHFLARFRQAKLINLVPFHPEEPKSYTFKFYKFFSLYIFFFFL